MLDIPDITIRDSGDFNLFTTCSVNPVGEGEYNWSVPFGNLTITLLPLTNQSRNVTRYQFFTFNARVNCTGGECGDANASLWYADARFVPVYVNATFETDEEGFVYQDDLYQATTNSPQENGVREANANCASGFCLAIDLNLAAPVTTNPFSGGWNKSFNVTYSPLFVNISFNFTLRLAQPTETGESASIYYRNATSRADIQGVTLEHDNPPADEFTSGKVSYIANLSNGQTSFDAGCFLTDVSATNENAQT